MYLFVRKSFCLNRNKSYISESEDTYVIPLSLKSVLLVFEAPLKLHESIKLSLLSWTMFLFSISITTPSFSSVLLVLSPTYSSFPPFTNHKYIHNTKPFYILLSISKFNRTIHDIPRIDRSRPDPSTNKTRTNVSYQTGELLSFRQEKEWCRRLYHLVELNRLDISIS